MNIESIRSDLQWLRGEDGVVSAAEAESVLARVLSPLFHSEGLEVSTSPGNPDLQFDLVAHTPAGDADRVAVRVVIEYKHHGGGRPIEVGQVENLIARVGRAPLYKRAMLIGRFGFTASAREKARKQEPVRIDLLDLNDIEAWIRRVEVGKPAAAERIQLLVRSIVMNLPYLSHQVRTLLRIWSGGTLNGLLLEYSRDSVFKPHLRHQARTVARTSFCFAMQSMERNHTLLN